MSEIIIDVDEPEVIVEEAYSTDYDLPIASATTLGGVKIGENIEIANDGKISVPIASTTEAGVIKVGTNLSIDENGVLSAIGGSTITIDSVLSTVSTNPVQNKVITSEISATNSTLSNLSTTVGNHATTIAAQGQSITTLQGNVTDNGNAIDALEDYEDTQDGLISTNTSNISANTEDITLLKGRMDDAEDAITTLNNGTAEINGNLNTLLTTIEETIPYSDIANYWTAGNVTIVGKGKIAYVNFDLEGSLTINGGSYENILEITDDALKPKYPMEGFLITNEGMLKVTVFTSGIFRAYNLSSSNITLSTLSGNIPIILN